MDEIVVTAVRSSFDISLRYACPVWACRIVREVAQFH